MGFGRFEGCHEDTVGRIAVIKQENPAVARKPRDAAAVLLSLKFADDIHYKFKIVAKLRKPGFKRAPNIPAQNRI